MTKEEMTYANNDEFAREKLEEARAVQDRLKKFDLIKQAEESAVETALQEEIQEELSSLVVAMKTQVAVQLANLKNRDNYEQFTIALRLLEGLKNDYPFVDQEIEQVEQARNWFDQKRMRDGARVSKVMQGGLRDKYVGYRNIFDTAECQDYYINVDVKLTYEEYLRLLREQWTSKSRAVCDKILFDAHATATSAPCAARARLNDVLESETGYELEEGNRTLRIKEYPFDDPEVERINAYINALERPCKQESHAQGLSDKANAASTPFARYDLLLKARGFSWQVPKLDIVEDDSSHIIPGLDDAILQVFDIAVKFRTDQIEEQLNNLQVEMEQLPPLSKDIIKNQMGKIEKLLGTVYGETISWPGTGVSLKIREGETIAIQSPEALEKLRQRCQDMKRDFHKLHAAYDLLSAEDKNIRTLLNESDAIRRQEGLQAFDRLKNNELITRFQMFTALEDFKIQQTNFEDGERNIREHFNNEDWSSVLRLSKSFELKPNYDSICPKEIKDNIAVWKQTADQQIKFQKLRELVERENFLGARRIWEQLLNDKVDLAPVKTYVEQIEEINAEGQAMLEFYQQSLIPYDLDRHILLEILQDRDGILDRQGELNANDRDIVKGILGESQGQVTSQQFEKNVLDFLFKHFKKVSFEQKADLLARVNHVAGIASDPHPDWPSGSSSYAQFEARLLAYYLKMLVGQEVIAGLKKAQASTSESTILAARSKIDAIYHFSFPVSDEEREILKQVEISYAQTSSGKTTPEQALKLWKTVKDHFEYDIQVLAKFSRAKQNWYISEVERLRAKSSFKEALHLIDKAFDDEHVGTIWQLYMEKAYTCLDMGDFAESRQALTEVLRKRRSKTAAVMQMGVEIELGEKIAQYQNDSMTLMKVLLDYWKIVEKKHKKLVAQALKRNYEEHTQRFSEQVRDKLEQDREKAWQPLLDLIKFEEIYLEVEPKTKRLSVDFIEKLIPSLFPTGINLIEEAENFDQNSRNHGVDLKRSISEGEHLHGRMVSYETLLSFMYEEHSDKVLLEDVVRHIINKSIKVENRRKEFLRELMNYVQDNSEPERKYIDVQDNRLRLRQNLDSRLLECQKRLQSASKPTLWLDCVADVLLGSSTGNSWKILADSVAKLQEYNNFRDVLLIQTALDSWKSTFPSIFVEYEILRERFYDEEFDQAEASVQKLENYFDNLPFLSNEKEKWIKEVITPLKKKMTVQNSYTKDHISGLGNIGKAITELKNEINIWEKKKREKQKEMREYIGKIDAFQRAISVYKQEYYQPHKGFMTTPHARERIDKYLDSVDGRNFEILQEADTLTSPTLPIPDFVPSQQIPSSPQFKQQTPKGSFFSSLFSRKNTAANPLLKGAKTSQYTCPSIVEQKKRVSALLRNLKGSSQGDHTKLEVNSSAAEVLREVYDRLELVKQDMIVYVEQTIELNDACQKYVPYPKKDELQEFYSRNQYTNMARRIIEADLIGSMKPGEKDDVNAFREILVEARWT